MMRTNDPLSDYSRWEAEQFLWEQSRPVCSDCGNPILDEYLWEFHGSLYCENCVKEHRQIIED